MYGSYVFLLVYAFIALLHPSVAAKALIGLNPNLIANYTANPLKVCIHPTPPLVMCDPVREQNQYTGFGVELFRLVYGGELGLREGEQYNFNCTEFENLIPQLSTPNSYCDIGLGGLVVTPERQSMGIRNSYPYYRSSLAIVVQSEVVGTSGWAWIKPFATSLWVAVILTIVIFPLLVFVIEFLALKRRVHMVDLPSGIEEATYRSLWTLMGQETLEVSTLGARIAVMCFAFLSLIISSTYTANLAAVLTVRQAKSNINSIQDLRGSAVATNPIYVELLRSQYAIVATSNYTLDDEAGLRKGLDDVLSGTLTALVTKETAARQVYKYYDGCSLRVLPTTYHNFDYAYLFSPSVDSNLIGNVSAVILQLQDRGVIEDLSKRFIDDPDSMRCDSVIQGENMSTEFYDVYGLWIILAAGVVVGFCIMFYTRRKRRKSGAWARQLSSKQSGGDGDSVVDGDEQHDLPDFLYHSSQPYIQGPAYQGVETGMTTKSGKFTSFLPMPWKKKKKGTAKKSNVAVKSINKQQDTTARSNGTRSVKFKDVELGNAPSSSAAAGQGIADGGRDESQKSALQVRSSITGDEIIWHSRESSKALGAGLKK